MKRISTKPLVFPIMILSALSLALAIYVWAGSQDKGSSSKAGMGGAVLKVTVVGEHQPLDSGSDTKGSETKERQPFGLRVTRITSEDGRELIEMKGVVLEYRDTNKSNDLIKKHASGDTLMIKGNLDLRDKVLEVESFKKVEAPGSDSKESGSPTRGSDTK
ncbi:MAG: hypothetical protein ABIN58_02835 [candidate division WOR-3 bacterium]